GRVTSDGQTQTSWSFDYDNGIDYNSGRFSLNQGIKTCTGGSAEEPTPKGCICQSTQSEQECACQEYDQREPCICLIVGDIRSHCIGHTIPSCEQATSVQLIDLSTDICECYEVGDPRSQCLESKACNDPSAELSDIPILRCECVDNNDVRAGISCPVSNECADDQINSKCLCNQEHQSPGCICTQSVHPQECICDQSSDAIFPSNICSSTKTCSGTQGDDEQIEQGQCICGEGHHPNGCLCKDENDINCICNIDYSPIGCLCPSNSEFNCACRWNVSQTTIGENIKSTVQAIITLTCYNYEIQMLDSQHIETINISKQGNLLIKGRETIDGQARTIWSIDFNQGRMIYLRSEGYFSLNQAQPCSDQSSKEPTPEGCICKLSQTEQKCICQENDQRQSCVCLPVGDSRIHCIGITIPCDQADLTNIPLSICECRSTGDPRAGQTTPGISCPS
ncbi:MAG: hypothetical protein EZS28_031795, partial [Streblomastix strix]